MKIMEPTLSWGESLISEWGVKLGAKCSFDCDHCFDAVGQPSPSKDWLVITADLFSST